MKRGLLYLSMVLFILENISGCVPLVIGGAAGVVGACAISAHLPILLGKVCALSGQTPRLKG